VDRVGAKQPLYLAIAIYAAFFFLFAFFTHERLWLIAATWGMVAIGDAIYAVAWASVLYHDLPDGRQRTAALAIAQGLPLLIMAAGPFIVRERREFSALILALATLIGGIGFLVSPSHAAFAPSSDLGIWAGLFRFADALNLDHNMVPSLHGAFAVGCVAAFARRASRAGGALLWMWAVAISLSTLFTHQHHVVDVINGWGGGLGALRFAMRRWG
jgi:membrane-associated phospholipid phosphatase